MTVTSTISSGMPVNGRNGHLIEYLSDDLEIWSKRQALDVQNCPGASAMAAGPTASVNSQFSKQSFHGRNFATDRYYYLQQLCGEYRETAELF
jgi:hypothetical protein